MKKFLLIETQKYWDIPMPEFNINLPLDVVQPLGLIQIASVIRQKCPDAEIRVLDLRLLYNNFSGVPEFVTDFNPEFVGFRGVSRDGTFMVETIAQIRALLPNAVLVAGGPHVTALREKIMDEAPLDFAVYGEGEVTTAEFLECLEKGSGYENVKGLMYRDKEGKAHINEPRELIQDLDTIPMPSWDLIDHEFYYKMMYFPHIPAYFNARREVVSIFTSRGCPFNCTFCHNIFGKKFRGQSPERVVEEISLLYNEYGLRQFDIRDDIFNFDKKRVHEICDLIIKKGLDIKIAFPNGLRGDIMDEELVLKLIAAGMFRVTYALETASPRLQKLIRKNINLDRLKEIIHFTSKQGVIIRLFTMLGFPTETREEMKMTIDYASDPAVDFLIVNTVNPFEGTDMAAQLRQQGVDMDSFRDKYDYLSIKFSVAEVSVEELLKIRDDARKEFFNEQRMETIIKKLIPHLQRKTVQA